VYKHAGKVDQALMAEEVRYAEEVKPQTEAKPAAEVKRPVLDPLAKGS
jgi:hypothetical protein